MALVLNDRVRETTSVVGTGAVTLLGAVTGFQSFSTIGNANTTYYCISDQAGANWEVGIGTYVSATPALARTTVLASSNAGALVSFTAGTKDVFVTYPSSKGVWYDASGNVLFTGTTTAANLAYTGTLTGGTGILNIGSGQVYKDASGNVGIGTSSPDGYGKLVSLSGSATVPAIVAAQSGAIPTLTAGTIGVFAGAMGNVTYGARITILGGSAGSSTLNFGTELVDYNGAIVYDHVNNAMLLATKTAGTSTEKMRIDSSGNVGIGTSSPTVKLDVLSGIGNITGDSISSAVASFTGPNYNFNTGSNPATFQIQSNSTLGADVGASIGLGGRYTGTSFAQFAIIKGAKENATDGNYATYLAFGTRLWGGQITEKMRIDSSGNVGIGTSSPLSTLHVIKTSSGVLTTGLILQNSVDGNAGGINSAIELQFAPSAWAGGSSLNRYSYIRGYNGGAGNPTYLVFGTNSAASDPTERMRIDSSGNVGIGTTSPTGKLDVAGTIKTLGYTVASLPTGVVGARAYVTNALTPVFGATVVTGGAVTIPVFYNGTNWIVG